MRLKFNTLTTSALALVAAQAAQAQGAFELDEITAFANLTPTETNRTGATVDIITEDELEAEGTARLSDFLARRAGISASSNGPLGGVTTLRVRGLGSQYVAVRIDGIDVTDPSAPQTAFNFGTLTTADISRVEIVKGSQSALYGTSAVAGVINITTRRAEEPGTTVSVDVEAGSYETYSGALNVATLGDRGEFSITASRITTDGYSAADENDGNTEADGYDATRLSFYGAYDVTDTIRLGLNGFYEENEIEFDSGFGPADGPQWEDGTVRGLRAFGEYAGDTIDHSLSISSYENERIGDFGGFPYDYTGSRMAAQYLGSATILGDSTLNFGAEYSEEEFESGSESAEGSRDTAALFAEGLFTVGANTDIAASLRYDDYSDFGDFVSGRLALAHRPTDSTVLRAVISNGFRAPSLYELNAPFSGNPNLEAEESINFELGVEQSFTNGASVQATLFRSEIDNLIQYDFTTFGYNQVPGTSTTQGVELAGSLPLGERAELFGNYTYTDARAGDGERLVRVPRHDLTLGVEGNITEQLSAIFTAQFVQDVVDTGGPLDDYVVAHATFNYDINDKANAYLRVENIFDEEYQTIQGYGTSDRAFYVGLRTSF